MYIVYVNRFVQCLAYRKDLRNITFSLFTITQINSSFNLIGVSCFKGRLLDCQVVLRESDRLLYIF